MFVFYSFIVINFFALVIKNCIFCWQLVVEVRCETTCIYGVKIDKKLAVRRGFAAF